MEEGAAVVLEEGGAERLPRGPERDRERIIS